MVHFQKITDRSLAAFALWKINVIELISLVIDEFNCFGYLFIIAET